MQYGEEVYKKPFRGGDKHDGGRGQKEGKNWKGADRHQEIEAQRAEEGKKIFETMKPKVSGERPVFTNTRKVTKQPEEIIPVVETLEQSHRTITDKSIRVVTEQKPEVSHHEKHFVIKSAQIDKEEYGVEKVVAEEYTPEGGEFVKGSLG